MLGASFGTVAAACGDAEEPGWSPLDGGNGSLDASDARDATIDAADAAPLDAGADDAGASAECDVDRLTFASIRGEGRSFGAAIAGNRVQLVYLVPACDDVGVLRGARNLRSVSLPTNGPPDPPRDLFDAEGCARPRDPTVVSFEEDRFAALYGAPREHFDLYLRPLTEAEPLQLTHEPGYELAPAAAQLGANAQPTALFLRAESEDDRETALVALTPGRSEIELSGGALRQLAVARFLEGGLVGWISESEMGRGIHALRIDSFGTPLGEPVRLSEAVGTLSAIAFASNGDSAAVVYSESLAADVHELRFREIGADGTYGQPRRITSGNEQVGEFAVAAHRNGYAILYRRLASELNPQPTLRLLFVDAQGNEGGSRFVSDVGARGSALVLLSARDGRLVALWDDLAPHVSPLMLDLQVARIHCR